MSNLKTAKKATKKKSVSEPKMPEEPRVYEKDFRRILTEEADKAYEEAEGDSDCCDKCDAYSIDLETAYFFARDIAEKTIKALKKASYLKHVHRK